MLAQGREILGLLRTTSVVLRDADPLREN